MACTVEYIGLILGSWWAY